MGILWHLFWLVLYILLAAGQITHYMPPVSQGVVGILWLAFAFNSFARLVEAIGES